MKNVKDEKEVCFSECGLYEGHSGSAVSVVKFNKDGRYFISGGHDQMICLWNVNKRTGSPVKRFKGHGWEVLSLSTSNDSTMIGSGGGDKQVFIWQVESGRILRKFSGHHTQRINCVSFNNSSSSLIASCSYDRTAALWDLRSNVSHIPVQILSDAKDSVSSLSFSFDDSLLITASIDGTARTYDLRNSSLHSDFFGNQPLTCVSISHDSNCSLFTCLGSKGQPPSPSFVPAVRLMDIRSGTLLNTYRGHSNSSFKTDSCLSYDESFVFCGSEDGSVYTWDLLDADNLLGKGSRSQSTSPILALSPHPSQQMLLSGSVSGSIILWSITTSNTMKKRK